MDEQWRPVVGHEEWYDISNLGDVMRVKAGPGTFVGRILRASPDSHGYPQVSLCKNGVQHVYNVYRLVAAAFLGERPEGYEINHIDGDAANHSLSNLEYVTRSDNLAHAYMIGARCAKGSNNTASKLIEDNVHEIRKLLGKESPKDIAARFNVSRSCIYAIANGNSWTHLKEEEDDNVEQ